MRLPDATRFDPNLMASTLLRSGPGALIPLASVGHLQRSNGQSELLRENLRSMALVSGHLEGRDLGSAIAEIRTGLQTLKLPVGYSYEIGGQYESQQQSFRELLMVFGIAVMLVFTILVIQFRAWVPALLILLAAPLSLGGALLLLWATGTDLNVSSAMGADPADRPGGEERHHAARLLGAPARRGRAVRHGRSPTPAASVCGRF